MNKEIVDKINKSGYKVFLTITGGGQNFIGDYLAIEGASKTILGCYVPYSQKLFDEFIGGKPDQYASSEGAKKLAVSSYQKALSCGIEKEYAIGIGSSNSVAASNEREGRERKINIAIQTFDKTFSVSYIFNQSRTREEENEIISKKILWLLAFVCGIILPAPIVDISTSQGERVSFIIKNVKKEMVDLIHTPLSFLFDGKLKEKEVFFPGSFNPYHNGHGKIIELAKEIVGQEPILELSVKNTDKPFLDYLEIDNRLLDLKKNKKNVILTNCPKFIDKVKMFRAAGVKEQIYIVGADTWKRIWDDKYGVSRETSYYTFLTNNVKFLVFPRNGINYSNWLGDNFWFDKLCSVEYDWCPVIQNEKLDSFNMDISSTEIRKKLNV